MNIDLVQFESFVKIWIALGAVTFVALFFVTAPYGRHAREGWGPSVPARWGWTAMEAPAFLLVALGLAAGSRPIDTYSATVGGLFLLHYAWRAGLFPWLLPHAARPMPLSIVLSAIFFNLVNGSLQGLWLGSLAPTSAAFDLTAPRTLCGGVLFLAGAATHLWADSVLRRLRQRSGEYRIPHGGLFRWVSCPNYLGEIVEWCGFAVLTGALPGTAFLVWTVANLAPRARDHHRWYRQRFPDYPPERRALVPYLF